MPVNPIVYGPVESWRLGRSLGIDLLGAKSTCSLQCVYCQLGEIEHPTRERSLFVPTAKLIDELKKSDWQSADVVTFSGSGEPTLALNLGEAIAAVKEITGKPVVVLTNSTLLHDPQVRGELAGADRVFCKLDAWTNEMLKRVNRPTGRARLDGIISGIIQLRREFHGSISLQTMLLRVPNDLELEELADVVGIVKPDELQLNLPTRPIPLEFVPEARGNELAETVEVRRLKPIAHAAYEQIGRRLSAMSGVPVRTR